MAVSKGGYRRPNNPAPVSGPGALSQRTDGGAIDGMTQPMQSYTGGTYGSNKAMAEQQGGAAMAGTPFQDAVSMPPLITPVSLDTPTQFPDEPLSYGANYGEGPMLNTSNVQGMGQSNIRNTIYRAMQFDSTGELEAIYNRLND